MEISTSISKTEGRKRTDTATVHLFTIHYSLFAICLAASAFAHDIETTSWGVCWKRLPSMPESIGPTNTPGSDAFCEYRLTAPAAYAFMDGFDTRLHAASCTNIVDDEMASDGFPKVTNTTHRFAFFDSLERGKENVRKLCPWYDAVETHDIYSGRWGSTFMDTLESQSPKRHNFQWTTDPFSEIYSQGMTGWFSIFYGLKKTGAFSPHDQDSWIPEPRFTYAGIAASILEDVTFYEPDYNTFAAQVKDATPFTFETVLSNAFANVQATNMLTKSRRLLPGRLAICDQALSLMDKTVRVDDPVAAITNQTERYFNYSMKADGAYAGNVTLTVSASGEYTASPLDLSFSPGSATVTNTVAVTNVAVSKDAPYLEVSTPYCGFGASLVITNSDVRLNAESPIYHSSDTFYDFLDLVSENAGSGEFWLSITIYEFGDEIYVDMYCEETGDFVSAVVENPKLSSGPYAATGKAAFSSSYDSKEGYLYSGAGHHENWPANRDYLKESGIKTTFISSYAAARAKYDGESETAYIRFTTGGSYPEPTEQWYNLVGYSYKAKTHELNFPSQYLAALATEIGLLSSKMFSLAPSYDNPASYLGVAAGDFGTMCERADEWALSVRNVWFGQEGWDSPSDVDVCVSKSGSSYNFWIVGSASEYERELPVKSIIAGLVLVDDEVLDVFDIPDTPFLFNSKLRSVSEAEWDFPQVKLVE